MGPADYLLLIDIVNLFRTDPLPEGQSPLGPSSRRKPGSSLGRRPRGKLGPGFRRGDDNRAERHV